MSREILFKAKRANWRELSEEEWWVEGSLITGVFLRGGQDISYILCPEKADYGCFEDFSEENGIFEVDPETVCQYTGLTDGSGRKVFENDITNVVFLEAREGALSKTYQYKVEFDQENASYELTGNDDLLGRPCFVSANQDLMEVIGNVFDSLELLKDGQQPESPRNVKGEIGMTENEAVKVLENEKECVSRNVKGCDRDCGKCDLVMDDSIIINVYDRAIIALQEIQQYRAIGTVEECREAKEKQIGKKPNLCMNEVSGMFVDYEDGHGEYKTQMNNWWRCPCCNEVVGQRVIVHKHIHDQRKKKYCENCGQAIKWDE